MNLTQQRLKQAASLIALLDRRRQMTGDPNLASNVERMIIDRELRELEEEILTAPGPLAAEVGIVHLRLRLDAASDAAFAPDS